jgi:hypothetical protein
VAIAGHWSGKGKQWIRKELSTSGFWWSSKSCASAVGRSSRRLRKTRNAERRPGARQSNGRTDRIVPEAPGAPAATGDVRARVEGGRTRPRRDLDPPPRFTTREPERIDVHTRSGSSRRAARRAALLTEADPEGPIPGTRIGAPRLSAQSRSALSRAGRSTRFADTPSASLLTVTWTNPDTATHQIVSRKAGFSSPVLSSLSSRPRVRRLPGTSREP